MAICNKFILSVLTLLTKNCFLIQTIALCGNGLIGLNETMTKANYQFIEVLGKRLETYWYGPNPGEAPTLIFLHEGLGSAELWRDFPQTLADACGCGALVYSRAGYGHSDTVELPRGTDYLHSEGLEVLPKLLEKLSVKEHILIGHSDGGSIALISAGGAPRAGLLGVITEAAHVFNEPIIPPAIRKVTPLYREGDLRERLAKYHDHVDAAFYGWHDTWLSDDFQSWNIEEFLPTIEVPALVLQGEDDHYGTPKQVEAIATQVENARAILIPNCAHVPHQEQREITLELMTDFIKTFSL